MIRMISAAAGVFAAVSAEVFAAASFAVSFVAFLLFVVFVLRHIFRSFPDPDADTAVWCRNRDSGNGDSGNGDSGNRDSGNGDSGNECDE